MAGVTESYCFDKLYVGQSSPLKEGKICRSYVITDHQPMEIKAFYLPDATLINILVRIAVFLHMREFTEGAAKARQHGG